MSLNPLSLSGRDKKGPQPVPSFLEATGSSPTKAGKIAASSLLGAAGKSPRDTQRHSPHARSPLSFSHWGRSQEVQGKPVTQAHAQYSAHSPVKIKNLIPSTSPLKATEYHAVLRLGEASTKITEQSLAEWQNALPQSLQNISPHSSSNSSVKLSPTSGASSSSSVEVKPRVARRLDPELEEVADPLPHEASSAKGSSSSASSTQPEPEDPSTQPIPNGENQTAEAPKKGSLMQASFFKRLILNLRVITSKVMGIAQRVKIVLAHVFTKLFTKFSFR